jgi:predicted phage tail protein
MAHLFTHADLHHHPGTSHAGEAGFFALVGATVVVVAFLLGACWLAQNALTGLAALATRI